MDTAQTTLLTPAERSERGREARRQTPPESHAHLVTGPGRDAVQVLAGQIPARLPELVPIRHERMLASPFAFYRGGAAVMAADLAATPRSGLSVQLCGDAHLSNFGVYASPERRLVFDINDFDETLPGPWEWDVKRLAASFAIAGRQNGYTTDEVHRIVFTTVRRYQKAMATFAGLGNLAVWYSSVDVDQLEQQVRANYGKGAVKRFDKTVQKARSRNHLRALGKLTEIVEGRRRFVSDPPLLVPLDDVLSGVSRDQARAELARLLHDYSDTLAPGPRELIRSYSFVDMARKVVGVGSVGTRCWVVLLLGRDEHDPLLLQVKEAPPSALARYVGGTVDHPHQGERVVTGQRIMQASSDIFLGAQRVPGMDGITRDFYLRQLHDWKGSADVEAMVPKGMRAYGRLCAWTLARAHACSGDRIAIAAYLGDDDSFARALVEFADAYADLNDRDHAAFGEAVAQDPMLGHGAAV